MASETGIKTLVDYSTGTFVEKMARLRAVLPRLDRGDILPGAGFLDEMGPQTVAALRIEMAGVIISAGGTVPDDNVVVPIGGGGSTAPTPQPTSIGGLALNSIGTTGPTTGMKLTAGDDFETLSLYGPAPAHRFGRWVSTRGDYLISDAGQAPRSSAGLGGYDVDPYFTGFGDSNRGVPIASMSDMITVSNGKLILKQRPMIAGEEVHVGRNNQSMLSSMIHSALAAFVRAPGVVEWEEQRFCNSKEHFTGWGMQRINGTKDDAEADIEAGSHPDGSGDGRQVEFNTNIWNGGTRSASRSIGSPPITVDWSTPHKFAIAYTDLGELKYYMDDVLKWTVDTESVKVLGDAYHQVFTAHMYNVTRPAGDGTYVISWFRQWAKTGHYALKQPHKLVQIASGENRSFTIPTAMDLWGANVPEVVEGLMVESNEHGGTTNGVLFGQFQPGVTYDAGTRTFTLNGITKPGRFNIGIYADVPGYSSEVFRIAVEVGPVITFGNFSVTQGSQVSIDLYRQVDCGVLVTDGVRCTKVITIDNLPNGLSLNGEGKIVGSTGQQTGTRTCKISVTNSVGQPATKDVQLTVSAPVTAGAYTYESSPNFKGRFDASRDDLYGTVDVDGFIESLLNVYSGNGDLLRPSGITAKPKKIANQQNGKAGILFVKTADAATSTVLETPLNSVLGSIMTPSDSPHSHMWLIKRSIGAGTGLVGGWSESANSSAGRNAGPVVRTGSASSDRYGATTSSTADVTAGTIPEDVLTLIQVAHGAGKTDVIVNGVLVADNLDHLSASAWGSGTARFSIGNMRGGSSSATGFPATAFAGLFFEGGCGDVKWTRDFMQTMLTEMRAKWNLPF